ncbi:hypothetical protein [Halobacterium noricense]|uniref:hypothetical protein n=1 Tax=Halobacterium noricense TaxID=223182 RepID=UPI001E5C4B80|nr:hypothetical protein [Halobacterium noricense]UHH25622.1 hypothetical protein LT974_01460 [Halobacterium noricense]
MPDTTTDSDNSELHEKVEKLENKVERLDEQAQGKNQIRIQAYDLSIDAKSEETGMRELLQMVSCEMDSMMTQALIGEYQELEQEDLFSMMFGGE